MLNIEIKKLEEILKNDGSLSKKIVSQAKKISNESELNDFLEKEIIPIAKKHNINLTKEDLLKFEKENLKELNIKDLSQVSGGVSLKPFLMSGGILATVMFGASMGALQTSASGHQTPMPETQNTQVVSSGSQNKSGSENQDNDLKKEGKDQSNGQKTKSEEKKEKKEEPQKQKKEKKEVKEQDKKEDKKESEIDKKKSEKEELEKRNAELKRKNESMSQEIQELKNSNKEYTQKIEKTKLESKETTIEKGKVANEKNETDQKRKKLENTDKELDNEITELEKQIEALKEKIAKKQEGKKEEQKKQQEPKEINSIQDCFIKDFNEKGYNKNDPDEKKAEGTNKLNWEGLGEKLITKNADKNEILNIDLEESNIENYRNAGVDLKALNTLCDKIIETNNLDEIKKYFSEPQNTGPQKRLALAYMQEYFKEKNNIELYKNILEINNEIDKQMFLNYFNKNENDPRAKILKRIFALMQMSEQKFGYKKEKTIKLQNESVLAPLCYGESVVFTLPFGMTEDEFLSTIGIDRENDIGKQDQAKVYKRASTHGIKMTDEEATEYKTYFQGLFQGLNLYLNTLTFGMVDAGINDYCFDIDINQFRDDLKKLDGTEISRGHVLIVFRNGYENIPPAVLIKFEDAAPGKISPTNHGHGASGTSNSISLTNKIKATMPFEKRKALVGKLESFEKETLIGHVETAAEKVGAEQLIGSQKEFKEACDKIKIQDQENQSKEIEFKPFEKKDTTDYTQYTIPGVEIFRCHSKKGWTGKLAEKIIGTDGGFTYYGYLINDENAFRNWCNGNDIKNPKDIDKIIAYAGTWFSTSKDGEKASGCKQIENILNDKNFLKFTEKLEEIKKFFTDHQHEIISQRVVTDIEDIDKIDNSLTFHGVKECKLINECRNIIKNINDPHSHKRQKEKIKEELKELIEENFSIPGVTLYRPNNGAVTYYKYHIDDETKFKKWCKDTFGWDENDIRLIKVLASNNKWFTTSATGETAQKWLGNEKCPNFNVLPNEIYNKITLIKDLFTLLDYKNPADITIVKTDINDGREGANTKTEDAKNAYKLLSIPGIKVTRKDKANKLTHIANKLWKDQITSNYIFEVKNLDKFKEWCEKNLPEETDIPDFVNITIDNLILKAMLEEGDKGNQAKESFLNDNESHKIPKSLFDKFVAIYWYYHSFDNPEGQNLVFTTEEEEKNNYIIRFVGINNLAVKNDNDHAELENLIKDKFSIPGVEFYRDGGFGKRTNYSYKITDNSAFKDWCKANNLNDEEIKKIEIHVGCDLLDDRTIKTERKDFDLLPQKFVQKMKWIKDLFTALSHKNPDKNLIIVKNEKQELTTDEINNIVDLLKIPGVQVFRQDERNLLNVGNIIYSFQINGNDDFKKWCENNSIKSDDISKIENSSKISFLSATLQKMLKNRGSSDTDDTDVQNLRQQLPKPFLDKLLEIYNYYHNFNNYSLHLYGWYDDNPVTKELVKELK